MRAAPIGAFFALDPDQIDQYIEASTRVTHTDPRPLTGAKAVAYLAAWALREGLQERPGFEEFLEVLRQAGRGDEEWLAALRAIAEGHEKGLSVEEFARSLGLTKGVTGYVYHTVPVVAYAWFRHFGDFGAILTAVLNCGGDTDTTGAIAGALAGAVVGEEGMPTAWLDGIVDWPRGKKFLTKLSDELAKRSQGREGGAPLRYFWPALLVRNFFFLVVVLIHGLRRLAPPY